MNVVGTVCGRGRGHGEHLEAQIVFGRRSEEAPGGEPRACLRRVSEGLTREFGLYLADSGEPLGAMEQAMHHFSLVSVPLFFQGYCLSLFLQRE